MEETRAWEESVEKLCLRLTPPLLLASLDSWYYPQGDAEDDRKEATNRIIAVKRWVDGDVPKNLGNLYELLVAKNLSSKGDLNSQLKSCIACAAAVYVSPRLEPEFNDKDGLAESTDSREPWITATNTKLAVQILRHPIIGFGQSRDGSISTALDVVLVSHLLQEYVKPLFGSTPSRNVNAATGRAAKAGLTDIAGTSTTALMEDEIIWKGGDVEHAAKCKVLGVTTIFEVEEDNRYLQRRHRGLGSYNVLYVCCLSIQAFQASGSSSWDHFWPLVLPPMLTLLEDSSPLYRLLGSRILNTTLLNGKDNMTLTGTLLLRTGVAALLRQNLVSSLTFISAKLSAPLLQSAATSLILLSQFTTANMYSSTSSPLYVIQDGGRERFTQLDKLIDDGILRVWAYAPASISALHESKEVTSVSPVAASTPDDDDDELTEANDVVNASIEALARLTRIDALGVGIARYLDVMLEFLTAQLMGLENKLERRKDSKRAMVSLQREIYSARAIEALLVVCKRAPGVRVWSSRCLDCVVRCWTLLQDQEATTQISRLLAYLDDILDALLDAQPDLMARQLQVLLELDEGFFMPLVGCRLSTKDRCDSLKSL
jgi:hypothetical protein